MTAIVDDTPSTESDKSQFEKLKDEVRLRVATPPWVLLTELFIGIVWIRAAVEKIVDPNWWNGSELSGFLDSHAVYTLPWYQGFVDTVVAPNLLAISIVVVVAQLFIGISLISDWVLPVGLATGLFLNFNFIAAGAVEPSIFYLVSQIAILLWLLHDKNGVARGPLRVLAITSLAIALLNVPFIWTLDPTWVVDDPAATLVLVGLLTALVSFLGLRRPPESAGTEPRAEVESATDGDFPTDPAATNPGLGSRRVG